MDDLLCRGEPLLDLIGLEIFAKAAKCVLTAKPFFFHAGDFGQLTRTADASMINDSNGRASLLCRVPEIIFGNRSSGFSRRVVQAVGEKY